MASLTRVKYSINGVSSSVEYSVRSSVCKASSVYSLIVLLHSCKNLLPMFNNNLLSMYLSVSVLPSHTHYTSQLSGLDGQLLDSAA